jgi:hypothetical protein
MGNIFKTRISLCLLRLLSVFCVTSYTRIMHEKKISTTFRYSPLLGLKQNEAWRLSDRIQRKNVLSFFSEVFSVIL